MQPVNEIARGGHVKADILQRESIMSGESGDGMAELKRTGKVSSEEGVTMGGGTVVGGQMLGRLGI